MRSRHPSAPLIRALLADAAAAGCRVTSESAVTTDWSSATFIGARHHVVLSAPTGAALSHWLASISATPLSLPRELVGELRVERVAPVGTRKTIALSALTIQEA
ncbi:hypothetical protein [Sphingomonas sp. 1P08PE]|uniref:hypothetical protein n=1 Tax=Sphingomonas sp. 1P08PE TaxID=554122 RepID=UPI0039A1946D